MELPKNRIGNSESFERYQGGTKCERIRSADKGVNKAVVIIGGLCRDLEKS